MQKNINIIIHMPHSKIIFIYELHCKDENVRFLKTIYQNLLILK